MGYLQEDDFVSDLMSGKAYSWVQAFVDTVKARLAASALSSWWLRYGYDPKLNHIDYARGVPYTAGGYAPSTGTGGQLTFDTTVTLSGKKSLKFNPSSSNDQLLAHGPNFRVSEGRSYLIKCIARQSALPNGVHIFGIKWLDKDLSELSNTGITFVHNNANEWRCRAFYSTAPTNARFASVFTAITLATDPCYVDEITVEDQEMGRFMLGAIQWWQASSADLGLGGTVPSGWSLCDGTVLNDPLSPLDGITKPNFNVGNGTGHFIRGTTGTTGVVQAADIAAHNHNMTHTHTGNSSGASGSLYPVLRNSSTIDLSQHHSYIDGFVGNTGNSTGTETRPKNITSRAIMRVR